MSRLYDRVSDLSLTVESYALDRHEMDTSGEFTRVTTVVALSGAGSVGRGEDVTYDAPDHDALQAAAEAGDLSWDLAGEYTLAEFSAALEGIDLFPDEPEREASRHYRRWALESAALDLALRQADLTFAEAVGRTYDPVRFAVSTRLGDPPTADRIGEWLDIDPGLEFKLDPTAEWDADLIADLAATDSVRVLDFKAHYEGTDVDGAVDPALYRRVAEGFPEAVLEDAKLTDETRPALADAEDRLSWDYPITGVESVEALPIDPEWLNVKPSRFGTVESLLATVEHCEAAGIRMYGGGQYELGVGREHLHALASAFYPDAPNDIAPSGYNAPEPRSGLPSSPLAVPENPRGLRWTDE